MAEQVADEVLRERGLGILEKELGPVLALRFLAMISRQTFDYQTWRGSHFDGLNLEQILSAAQYEEATGS
jgi:hypothetical protein